MTTESTLKEWRGGQAQAERLVAGLLYLEGYKRIDPQLPLGGPDGKKDILFSNDGKKWIAAAYFPTTDVTFTQIKRKFLSDLDGLVVNDAQGMAFFVSHHLTPAERRELLNAASPRIAEIFHLERMRALLDSPSGCGLRLEYLRIPMTEEEQWAFWQTMNSQVMQTLVESDKHLQKLHDKVDILLMRTQSLEFGTVEEISSIHQPASYLGGQTANLNSGMLMWIHRMMTDSARTPEALRGKFRAIQVWIGGAGVSVGDARYVPPPPEEIPGRLESLLIQWRDVYPSLLDADRNTVLLELARFHHGFLSLHPFPDANGRVARAVLDQAAHELLGMRIGSEIGENSDSYYEALEQADRGNLAPLITVLQASLSR